MTAAAPGQRQIIFQDFLVTYLTLLLATFEFALSCPPLV
jgi:hypothetical protein